MRAVRADMASDENRAAAADAKSAAARLGGKARDNDRAAESGGSNSNSAHGNPRLLVHGACPGVVDAP